MPCVVLLAGASLSPPELQYWYSRAHRALKQRASEPAQLLREYQHVTALDASIGHGVGVARSRAAAGRNRYGNVLPYDHNRCGLLLLLGVLPWVWRGVWMRAKCLQHRWRVSRGVVARLPLRMRGEKHHIPH